MTSKATTPAQYLRELPEDRRAAVTKLWDTVTANLPDGFVEGMDYGMPGWSVPHSLYPAGYHVDPKIPLPFAGVASQKNFIAFYHMGIYADPALLEWFQTEYPKHSKAKLDMGKSCIRFKKPDQIPYQLIGQLMKKMSAKKWISIYENEVKNARKKSR